MAFNLVRLNGETHIFDNIRNDFVSSRGVFLAKAIENLPHDVREIMVGKNRVEQLEVYRMLYSKKEGE